MKCKKTSVKIEKSSKIFIKIFDKTRNCNIIFDIKIFFILI